MVARVQDQGQTSEPSSVPNGTKQGCVMAPLLFTSVFSAMLNYAFHDIRTAKTYVKHAKEVSHANMVANASVIDEAVQVVRKLYEDHDTPSVPLTEDSESDNPILNITVSFDGTWMTRGHKPKYVLGCVIEIETGLVIDFFIMSLYCHSCAGATARYGGVETDEYIKRGQSSIKTVTSTTEAHPGGGMEMEAAKQLWSRPLDKYGFRYTTL